MNCGCHGITGSEIRLSWRLGVVVVAWGHGCGSALGWWDDQRVDMLHSHVANGMVAVALCVMGLGCREPGCGDPSVEGGCRGIVAGRLWLPRSVVKGTGWPLCCG